MENREQMKSIGDICQTILSSLLWTYLIFILSRLNRILPKLNLLNRLIYWFSFFWIIYASRLIIFFLNKFVSGVIYVIIHREPTLSASEVEYLLANTRLALILPGNTIDFLSVENPFNPSSTLTTYQTSSTQGQKTLITGVYTSIVSQDKTDFYLSNKKYESFVLDELRSNEIQSTLDETKSALDSNSISDENVLFVVKLGFGYKKFFKEANRTFRTIAMIMGNLGGGIKIVVLIGFIIVNPFAKLQFQKTMLNEVFNFESENTKLDHSSPELKNEPHSLREIDDHRQFSINETICMQVDPSKEIPKDQPETYSVPGKILNSPIQRDKKTSLKIEHNIFLSEERRDSIRTRSVIQRHSSSDSNNNSIFLNINNPSQTNNCISHIEDTNLQFQSHNSLNSPTIKNKPRVLPSSNFISEYIKESILNRSSMAKIPIEELQSPLKRPFQSQQQQQKNSTSPQANLNSMQPQQSIETEAVEQQKMKKKKKEQQKADDNIFQKLFRTTYNPLKLSFLQNVFYFIWPFGRYHETKQKIRYSISKLNYHLDSLYIIKKLLEVDKLKMLLLNEDQIKLLEYLPKPTIDLSHVQNHKTQSQAQQSSVEIAEQNINFLYQDTRNYITKATQAFEAFNSIKSKSTLSKIDRKLIDLLDPKIAKYFDFNENNDDSIAVEFNEKRGQQQNDKLFNPMLSSIGNYNGQNNLNLMTNSMVVGNSNSSAQIAPKLGSQRMVNFPQTSNSGTIDMRQSTNTNKKSSMFKRHSNIQRVKALTLKIPNRQSLIGTPQSDLGSPSNYSQFHRYQEEKDPQTMEDPSGFYGRNEKFDNLRKSKSIDPYHTEITKFETPSAIHGNQINDNNSQVDFTNAVLDLQYEPLAINKNPHNSVFQYLGAVIEKQKQSKKQQEFSANGKKERNLQKLQESSEIQFNQSTKELIDPQGEQINDGLGISQQGSIANESIEIDCLDYRLRQNMAFQNNKFYEKEIHLRTEAFNESSSQINSLNENNSRKKDRGRECSKKNSNENDSKNNQSMSISGEKYSNLHLGKTNSNSKVKLDSFMRISPPNMSIQLSSIEYGSSSKQQNNQVFFPKRLSTS